MQAELQERRSEGVGFTLTVDPDAGHDRAFWNGVYSRSALYTWLLTYKRSEVHSAHQVRHRDGLG